MSVVATCLVCGGTANVRMQLTHWREPIGDRRFENVPRCVERDACRQRVAANGDAWPLADQAPKREATRSPRRTR